MDITIDDAIKKVRIAIDDIVKDEDKDEDFTADAATELKQAVEDACTRVSQEAPADYVIPKTVGSEQWTDKDGNADGQTMNADGSGYLVLPSDFLRFVELRLASWGRSVFELLVPGSNEANMQVSRWSRGNALKPKAMIANAPCLSGRGALRAPGESSGFPRAGAAPRRFPHYTSPAGAVSICAPLSTISP